MLKMSVQFILYYKTSKYCQVKYHRPYFSQDFNLLENIFLYF